MLIRDMTIHGIRLNYEQYYQVINHMVENRLPEIRPSEMLRIIGRMNTT